MRPARATLFGCVLLALAGSAQAYSLAAAGNPANLRGEFDLEGGYADSPADSVATALGVRHRADRDLRLRLMASPQLTDGWRLDMAYLLRARQGGGVLLDRRQRALAPDLYVNPRRTSLLRLSDTIRDRDRQWIEQRIDRLLLGYSGAHLVLRIGRQALTWGNGLVFHPMDLFNPFSPNATYTAYKPGTDMLYGQWLFDSGADVQAVVVPRRNPVTSRVETDQSSAGIKWHGFVGPSQSIGIDLLLARDYRSDVLGLAASGALGGASWSAELLPTRLVDGRVRTSALANAQYAWQWGRRSVSGYVEYLHNGFGVDTRNHSLATLPTELRDRLARGTVFTVSTDYLALGANVQWTPLLVLKPSVIGNLRDGSALLLGQAVYSLSQNTSLTAGLQWPLGPRGTEYGGLPTVTGASVYTVPERRVYARFSWYF